MFLLIQIINEIVKTQVSVFGKFEHLIGQGGLNKLKGVGCGVCVGRVWRKTKINKQGDVYLVLTHGQKDCDGQTNGCTEKNA